MERWQEFARQVIQVEMELSGVYEAARTAGRENYPVLAIRGLSDIVGFARDGQWTAYACKTAAAYAAAYCVRVSSTLKRTCPPAVCTIAVCLINRTQRTPRIGQAQSLARLPHRHQHWQFGRRDSLSSRLKKPGPLMLPRGFHFKSRSKKPAQRFESWEVDKGE